MYLRNFQLILVSTMSFNLKFDANSVEPIQVFTAEMRATWWRTVLDNLSEAEVFAARVAQRESEDRARAEFKKQRHEYFLRAAGAKHSGMDVATAKKYVRARAASCLQQAFETLEEVMVNGKIADRLEVAGEIIKRAVGPAAVPNSLSDAKGLTELAPVDAIDAVLTAYANGECDEQFVKTLLGLLGAKVNGLKIEQATAKKSADKVANPIGRPPSGKIV